MYRHKNGTSFRKLGTGDLGSLLDLKGESWPTTHKTAILNEDDQRAWFASLPRDCLYMLCTIDEGTGSQDLGLLTLNSIDTLARTALIGGSIFRKWRGSEWSRKAWEAGTDFAFEMLNLHRLDAEVVEYNVAALAMDLEIGYRVEGRRRQAVHKCGRYYDSMVLGLLRSEWEASDRVAEMGFLCNQNFRLPRPGLASRVLERVKVPLEENQSLVEG